jgi:hypothetical protein
MSQKKSWRDIYKVHPAADLFPMLPEDELRKLGNDIKANGLKETITLWRESEGAPVLLLDGRNRLAAMELVGMGAAVNAPLTVTLSGDVSPVSFVISKNIRRRHLTKAQIADIIVMTVKADFAAKEKTSQSIARSFSADGQRGGSTKDPVKESVIEKAKKHGISKRTVENAIAKAKGPTHKARAAENAKTPSPETPQAPLPQGKQQEKRPLDTEQKISLSGIIKTLGQTKSKRQIENENHFLLGEVADLRSELVAVRSELLQAQMKQVENLFRAALRGTNMDLTQWRRYLAKKYHPDVNSGKTFTAGEVMADINPLLKSLSGDGVSA